MHKGPGQKSKQDSPLDKYAAIYFELEAALQDTRTRYPHLVLYPAFSPNWTSGTGPVFSKLEIVMYYPVSTLHYPVFMIQSDFASISPIFSNIRLSVLLHLEELVFIKDAMHAAVDIQFRYYYCPTYTLTTTWAISVPPAVRKQSVQCPNFETTSLGSSII